MNIFINTKQENRNKLRLKDDKLFYLAYGSNLNEKQMLNLRCPGAIKIGSIYLEGFRLVFREVADFAEDSSSNLAIGLWEISKQHEQSLDIYEGVNSGLYKKIFWEISINDTSYKALIYKMNSQSIAEPRQNYLDTIVQGFDDFNLDKKTLEDAVLYSSNNKRGNPYIRKIDRRKA